MDQSHIAQVTTVIQAPPAKVWKALTDPTLIKQYMFDTDVTTDWKVDSPIRYKGIWKGKPYEDKGTVLKNEPEQLLVTSFWSALSGQPDEPENYKTVQYELIPEDGGTRLTITQDNNATQDEASHSEENWKSVLEGIKKVVEP
jgi:uncharacterized protein YndB with AHSA1/START domain